VLYVRNIIGTSSEIFGYLRESSENVGKMFGDVRQAFETILENLRKSSESHQKHRYWYVYIINRILHARLRIWIYLLVFNSISHLFAALTRAISSWTLEDKIHIHAQACNILSIVSKFSAPTIAFLAFWLAKKLRLWANSRSFTSLSFTSLNTFFTLGNFQYRLFTLYLTG